jgi:DNA-binding NarL/FixJ family response regulator
MDVHMPELYGDDVAAVLRQRGSRARILLFSNLPPDVLAQRSAEAGLDGYFSKKDGIEALVARVQALLA